MVLITVGPLTNIARTIKKYPQFVKLVKHMYMMGGTLSMRGNVSPVAEANVACDPVAAVNAPIWTGSRHIADRS